MTRYLFDSYCPVHVGRPLTRGRVYRLSESQSAVISQLLVYTIYARPLSVQAKHSRSCSVFRSFRYNGSQITSTAVCLTIAKFKPHICFVGLRLVQCCEHLHFQGFVWLMLVACIILLHNHICTEVWKPCASCEPVCALVNFQWCGEPCFTGAAISVDSCLPQTPRRDKHKSLYS
jgi:hypothetical protein